MARQNVYMTAHTCDAARCDVTRHAPDGADGPAGWFIGTVARIDPDGFAPDAGQDARWEACSPRHVRGAVEAVLAVAQPPAVDVSAVDAEAEEGRA